MELPGASSLRAWLDRAYGHGGLLVAAGEVSLGDWAPDPTPVPRVRWPLARALSRLGGAVAFCLLAQLVPNTWIQPTQSTRLDLDGELARLEAEIDTLEEIAAIEETRERRYREALTTMRDEASAEDPGKSWEAIDALDRALERHAQQAFAEIESQDEAVQLLQGAVEALESQRELLSAEDLTGAMAELAELTEAQLAENEAMQRAMAEMGLVEIPGLEQMLEPDGKVDPARLKEMLALSEDQLKRLADALREVDLIEWSQCKSMGGKPDIEKLIAYLEENKKLRLSRMCQNGLPLGLPLGSGHGTDGGGASPLTWLEASTSETLSFEAVALEADLTDLGRSIGIGTSATDHERGDDDAARFDALAQTRTGTGSAHAITVLPRHRAAVKRYFDKPDKER